MAKNSRLLRWLTAGTSLVLAALAAPAPARGAMVWTATFESGDLSEFTPGINGTNGERMNIEVLGEQVYAGMYAGKITIHPDDTFTFGQNRVDIQHQSDLTDEGEESWLSGHYFLPEDAKVRNQIGFYESNTSFQNVMDFWVEPKEGGGTTLTFGVGFLGETEVWSGDFAAGVWHQIAIHVLWSEDEATGRVDVWLDGVQVVTDYPAKTKADGNSLFYQTGLHRTAVAEFTETIYIDNFIEADSFADAGIMAPMGQGGSGGTGGVGGAGGTSGGGGSGGAGAGGTAGAAAGSAGTGGTGGGSGGAGGAVMGGAAGATTSAAGMSARAPAAAGEKGGCSLGSKGRAESSTFSLMALLGLVAMRRRRARTLRS